MFGMADQCRVHMLLQHWLDIHSRIDEGKEEEKQSRAKAQLAQGKYHRKDHTIRKYSYAAYAMRFVKMYCSVSMRALASYSDLYVSSS